MTFSAMVLADGPGLSMTMCTPPIWEDLPDTEMEAKKPDD
jgi:hypothetical protein